VSEIIYDTIIGIAKNANSLLKIITAVL